MSLVQLIAYYVNLLIIQYKGKPKAEATIAALADLALDDMIALDVRDAYELGQAVGAQLDVIGKYAGVSRTGYTFFGQVTLNDDEFTTLIQLAILKNSAGSSLYDIQVLLNIYFPTTIFVFDYKQMRMSYFLSSDLASSNLAQMFIVQQLLPVPMGVRLSSLIYFPVLDQFFGFRSYTAEAHNATPFNTYDDYQLAWPWLSYSYAIDSGTSFDESLKTESGDDRIVQEDGSLMFI